MSFLDKIFGGGSSGSPPADVRRPGASYMRGGRSVVFRGWKPFLREAQRDIGANWDMAAARAHDAIVNSGWLSGMIDQAVANTVGGGLRVKPQPENEVLGQSREWATAWSKSVSQKFELWARTPADCDIEGHRTLARMQADAFRAWIPTGEILAEIPWRRRAWSRTGTKVRVLPPQRLSRSSDPMRRIVNGVSLDADGMPVGYLVKRQDEFGSSSDDMVNARDRYGRQRVVHVFNGPIGTCRGIGVLTPVLQVIRQFDQFSDATLTKAIVSAVFAATIESDAPTEEVLEGLLTPKERTQMALDGVSQMEAFIDATGGFYEGASLDLGINGRLSHMFPGDKLTFNAVEGPGPDQEKFFKMLLREIARALGMSYESATGDFAGATYYSLGKSGDEIFSITKMRRDNVVVPFSQPIYEAWLEEEIEAGRIEFPGGIVGFHSNRAAACRAEWHGSPKNVADVLKHAKAQSEWVKMGVKSISMVAEELGYDYEDVCQAIASDADLQAQYGIERPLIFSIGAPSTPPTEDPDENDGEKPGGGAEDDDA